MGSAIIFPGQGTQHARMGEPWRATPSWVIVDRAEAALDRPLAHLLLEASDDDLARTLEAQLAVFLHSLMAWHAMAAETGAVTPVAFAGHSLGQLTALVAAQALTLEDGVRLVAARAAATQAAADRRPGRMIALIGADLDVAELAASPDEGSWIANDNAPGQIVLGGTPDGIDAAAERAKALGVRRVIPLKVGGAFHTPLFSEARDALRPVLEATPFGVPVAPVVSNVDGEPHTDPTDWPTQLADHLVSPVLWRPSLLTLSRLGADALVEVGPGNVLAGLARRTLPGVPVRNLAVPADTPILTSWRFPEMEPVIGSGERLAVPERVIVAPASGKFRPADAGPSSEGHVDEEQVIGFVDGVGHSTPVLSPFRGFLMGLLAHAGERVREGQPVAWLRTA